MTSGINSAIGSLGLPTTQVGGMSSLQDASSVTNPSAITSQFETSNAAPAGDWAQGYAYGPAAEIGGLASSLSGLGAQQLQTYEAAGLPNIVPQQALSQNALANQFLGEYEAGQLPAGTQEAISQAYQEGANALGQEYSSMGVTPQQSTSYGQGMQQLSQEKDIATQTALEQELQSYNQASQAAITDAQTQLSDYYQSSQQELSALTAQASILLSEQEIQVQQEEFAQEMAMQQEQMGMGAIGSLFSSIGSFL